MEMLFAVGIGVGLASIAGVRAYLPLALVGLFAVLGLFALPPAFELLDDWPVIGALLVLALLETVLDKVSALDPGLDFVQTPVRVAAGAVLFSTAMDIGIASELAAGAVIAGVVAILKAVWRPPANVAAAGVSTRFLSFFEDVVALVGAVIAMFVPYVPLALVAFLLFFFYRVRKRRGRKYGGLRILGD